MPKFAFAGRLGFYLRVLGKELMHHQPLVRAHWLQINIVLKEPRALRQHARALAHLFHRGFVVSVYIYEKACRLFAVLSFHQTARYHIKRAQMLAAWPYEARGV